MDNLFAKREAVCAEVTREKHRKEMRALIEKYDNQMKNAIVDFYKAHEADIKRIIEVCDELKTCEDGERLNILKNEYDRFKRSCANFMAPRTRNRDESLIVYNCEGRRVTFPQWDPEVSQEWLLYWKVPVLLASYQQRNSDAISGLGDMYHLPRSNNELVVEIDHDYKADTIWLCFDKTICDCHRWRERYGLLHLDAIVLHIK